MVACAIQIDYVRLPLGTAPEKSPRRKAQSAATSSPDISGKVLEKWLIAYYIRHMLTLSSLGAQIAAKRKTLGLTQAELADKASISRATLDALENGRSGELGFSKITKILSALGLGLKLQESGSQRPTLDELIEEDRNDQGVERRR